MENQSKKQEILDAALRILKEKEFEEFNMRSVAKEANVSVGTLYNYFEDKKEILIVVIVNKIKKIFDSTKELDLQKDFFIKVKNLYFKIEEFVNWLKPEVWANINLIFLFDEGKGLNKQNLTIAEMHLQKFKKDLEEFLENQIKKDYEESQLILSAQDLSKLILQNLMVMARFKSLEYEKFELIIKKLLQKSEV